MKKALTIPLLYLFLPMVSAAQGLSVLRLPNQEQLPSGRVTHVVHDSEGALWYATVGGGIARDDGCTLDVFRSSASQPGLLGGNDIGCLAEAGPFMVVGSHHGAYVLDKRDYTISRLTDVDDKRVDDILVMRSGEVLLTANKKVYRYSPRMKLTHTYDAHGKYVAHLFEDAKGRIWATQWGGGLLSLHQGALRTAPWPVAAAPTDMADGPHGSLWIGTVGRGVVCYRPESGTAEAQPASAGAVCTDLQPTADGRQLWVSTTGGLLLFTAARQLEAVTHATPGQASGRLSLDRRGLLLVAGGQGQPTAIGASAPWPLPQPPTAAAADSLMTVRQLSQRPAAVAQRDAPDGELWFSTGRDIRLQRQARQEETVVLPNIKDVSAMTFAPDGTLWMGTIYGVVYRYSQGTLTTDAYAGNEHGDAIVACCADTTGLLTIVYDRYARCYNPQRHTLRQQSIEPDSTYRIELAETRPNERWSHPPRNGDKRLAAQQVWWAMAVATLLMAALTTYTVKLHRLRKRFLAALRQEARPTQPDATQTDGLKASSNGPTGKPNGMPGGEWLQKAIDLVESHLSDDSYSIEQLSSDLCMSRMTFYRKIQQATGQKPTEFIRSIKLRHAAELLRKGEMNIKEISFATGFTSVSYFSRCFRATYGVPPTQFC